MIEQQQQPAVNLEHQGILSKLLAREDVQVRHGNFPTASFNTRTRTLFLPLWQNKGKAVYDLLCGHEVGHALYTPVDGGEKFAKALPGVPFSICNIVEDVRIERMIQDTYPGLSSSFRAGYARLTADDFFGLKGKDLSKLNLADRFNIHAKTRGLIPVPLSDKELEIYDRALKADSFDDVLAICKELADLVKSQQPEQQQSEPQSGQSEPQSGSSDSTADDSKSDEGNQSQDTNQNAGSDDESSESDQELDKNSTGKSNDNDQQESNSQSDQQNESSEQSDDSESGQVGSATGSPNYSDVVEELTSKTSEAFQRAVNSMTVNEDAAYFYAPSEKAVKAVTIPYSTIMADRKSRNTYDAYMNESTVQGKIVSLRSKAKKYVATLTTEFNMRKAAYQYSRASIARTGVINMNRLHSYRYADDIFKSVTRLADAKNHGMIFIVDYSSSMNIAIGTVLEHTVNLVLFCRSLNIPFQVFAFTNPNDDVQSTTVQKLQCHGEVDIHSLSIMELFSSAMSKSEFELAVDQTLAQVAWHSRTATDSAFMPPYRCPVTSRYESMHGTPLLETIVVAHTLVNNFRKANPVQKMNVLFLTDGDGCMMSLVRDTTMPFGGRQLIGTLNGRRIKMHARSYEEQYMTLITSLRKSCNCTTTCFFVPSSENQGMKKISEANCSISKLKNVLPEVADESEEDDEVALDFSSIVPENVKKAYRRDKCVEIAGGFGYSAYYVLSAPRDLKINAPDEFDPEFSADEKVTVSKLTTAFSKFNTSRRNSRVLLNRFAIQIA